MKKKDARTKVYRRLITSVEGFSLACPLLAFARPIDKYRLACTWCGYIYLHVYFLVTAVSRDECSCLKSSNFSDNTTVLRAISDIAFGGDGKKKKKKQKE